MADQPGLSRILDNILTHLRRVEEDPSTLLDEKLLQTAAYTLASNLDVHQTERFIDQVYSLLPKLQQSPDPLIPLLVKATERVSLLQILDLHPPINFVHGLTVGADSFNLLILQYLEKADITSAQRLASTRQDVFQPLVILWLSTENEGVADKAGKVLLNLLRLDRRDPNSIGGDGPVWKRVFRDKDVYEKIFSITDTKTGRDKSLSKNRKTVAQARLMDWLPSVGALDWASISQSYHSELESTYDLPDGEQSLLDYAATYMVDYKGDVMLHRVLMGFFSSLLQVNPENSLHTSPALKFLVNKGLHKRTLGYYITPDEPSHDPLDVTFLYGEAAKYTATWVSTYPASLTEGKNSQATASLQQILKKITKALEVPASRWAVAYSPAEDLHVLSSLPRRVLLTLGSNNPIHSIPSRAANTDALNTLATIFHGPIDAKTVTFPPQPPDAMEGIVTENSKSETEAARDIYFSYISQNDRLWADIISHADTIALKDAALAAINLVKAVITAPWDGIKAINEPPARSSVIPWLLAHPKSFSNLVGGRGDAESAAYVIATARFEAAIAFYQRVKEREGFEDLARAFRARMAEGPQPRGGEIGGRIGTLEL